MNKQFYAALSLVCGLLGFNLIAVVQSMAYMQVSAYQRKSQVVDLSLFTTPDFYRIAAVLLGILATALYFLYKKSGDQEARLFSIIGLILGILSFTLGVVEVWTWLI
jgi:hypothetical protein